MAILTELLIAINLMIGSIHSLNTVDSYYIVAKKTPLSFSEVKSIAYLESTGNPKAESHTGAKGLYQFTSHTWGNLNDKYEFSFPKSPTNNLYQQTVMMIHLINDNVGTLKTLKYIKNSSCKINVVSIYIAHNIGVMNAFKICSMLENETVDSVVRKDILIHNKTIYIKKNGIYRTKKEIYLKVIKLLTKKQ